MISRALGDLKLPGWFPIAAYDTVNDVAARHVTSSKDTWHLFASAWTAVARRSRAAEDHANSLIASLASSSAPPPEESFRQDHDLLVMFVSLQSALEATSVATYTIASLVSPLEFPITKSSVREISLKKAMELYERFFNYEPLTSALKRTATSVEWKEINELRNALAHRGSPPRIVYLTNVPGMDRPAAIPINLRSLATDWSYELELAAPSFQRYTYWLKTSVTSLVTTMEQFVVGRS
jgi:hypothetical protein